MGDRECPECGQESLVEKTISIWKCLNPECKMEFDEEWLDEREE